MNPNNILKPAKLILTGGNVPTTQEPSNLEVTLTLDDSARAGDHDYAMEASMANQTKRKDVGSAPATQYKPPAGKKSKGQHDETEVSNLTILEAIRGMEKNFDELKEQAKQTSCMLAALTKAVQFNTEEVKECKEKVKELEKQH